MADIGRKAQHLMQFSVIPRRPLFEEVLPTAEIAVGLF